MGRRGIAARPTNTPHGARIHVGRGDVAPGPRYGSVAQVASDTGLSPKTIRRPVVSGTVRGDRVGRRLPIPFKYVDRHKAESRRRPDMTTIHRTEAPEVPYVPPMDPDELARRNRAAAALLDAWESEGDEEEQRATFAALREALGDRRIMSSRPALP
jgi:hypothetical protein